MKIRAIKPHNLATLKNDKLYRTLINTRLAEVEFMKYTQSAGARRSLRGIIVELDKEIKRLEK